MRNVTLLDNVDASVQQISNEVNFDHRGQWKLLITSSGLDGTPQLFIEEGFTGGKCITPPSEWFVICNPCNDTGVYFPIDDDIITIEKNSIKGNWMRVRVEANDNTTGNITVKLGYKTFP